MAKLKGLQNGDKIDYFTGKEYIPQVEKVNKRDIDVVKEENPKEFKKEGIVIDKIKSNDELQNEDLDELD